MATADPSSNEYTVEGVEMPHLDELDHHTEYEQLFADNSTLLFLPYESNLNYNPEDVLLEQAFKGNVQAFECYTSPDIPEGTEAGVSPLLVACHCGHLPLVRYLCENGDSVNAVSVDRMSPLFVSAVQGHIHIMAWLLDQGANVDIQEASGSHPLMVSAFQRRTDMVKLLLKHGASVNLTDNCGRTALMAAAQQGAVVVVETLLQKGSDVGLADQRGSTAAVYAAMADQYQVLTVLHKFQPDLFRICESNDIKLLSHVCRHGNLGLVKAIDELDHSVLDEVDGLGRTALMAATEGGHEEIVKYLVDHKVSVNVRTASHIQALTIAILQGNSAIIKILLPNLDQVDNADDNGNTLLLLASEKGDLSTVKSLIESSADVNYQNNLGLTPLMVSSKAGHKDVVDCLLKSKPDFSKTTTNNLHAADMAYLYHHFAIAEELRRHFKASISSHLVLFISARGNIEVIEKLYNDYQRVLYPDTTVEEYGVTALMVASYRGHVDMVNFLLSHGVPVNTTNRHGFSALEYAVARRNQAVVDILFGHGLALSQSISGQTLLHTCIASGRQDLVSYLLDLGADVNARTSKGRTPLMIASEGGWMEIVQLLVRNGASLQDKCREELTAQEYAFVNNKKTIEKYLKETEALQNSRKELDNPIPSHLGRFMLENMHGGISMGFLPSLHTFNLSPFLRACMADDQEEAARLKNAGCNVHSVDIEGENALTMVCERGYTGLAEWLIAECNLSPNSSNSDNLTALMAVSRGGHLGCANVLLQRRVLVNARDTKTGRAALHIAAANNHSAILVELLNHNALVDIEDSEGVTPLSVACLRGNMEAVECLINNGAKINHRDQRGRTAVTSASRNGHLRVLELLVKHGAVLSYNTNHGKSAMSYACQNGHHEVVAWLERQIAIGQTKEAATESSKMSSEMSLSGSGDSVPALHGSTQQLCNDTMYCHVQGEPCCPLCYEGLIEPQDNPEKKDHPWSYSIIPFVCVRQRHLFRLITIIHEGFDINHRTSDGTTLLMLAASLGYIDIVSLLAECGADVAVKNHSGQDALAQALKAGHYDVAQLLADRIDTRSMDVVLIKGFEAGEEVNGFIQQDKAHCQSKSDQVRVTGALSAASCPGHNTAEDLTVKLYQQIKDKWNEIFDEAYKVVTMMIQRDGPVDIQFVSRNWESSELYVYVNPSGVDRAREYMTGVLAVLPCAKYIQVHYVCLAEGWQPEEMFVCNNPEEYVHRQLALAQSQSSGAHCEALQQPGGNTGGSLDGSSMGDQPIPDETAAPHQNGETARSRPKVKVHSDRELMDKKVCIQGTPTRAKIVMTGMMSQYRKNSTPTPGPAQRPTTVVITGKISHSATKPNMAPKPGIMPKAAFSPNTFAVAMAEDTADGTGLNGCLVYLADSQQPLGFVVRTMHGFPMSGTTSDSEMNTIVLCMKVN